MKRSVLAILLAVVLTVSLLTVGAAAVDDVSFIDANGTPAERDGVTAVTTGTTEWTDEWYVVNSNVPIADRITVTGNVNLILADGCTLTATKGISVTSGNSLTIYGQSTEGNVGKLIANAQYNSGYAAIGGEAGDSSDEVAAHGNITINGGIITATSSYQAAGIGSGRSGSGTNGIITINGGDVTATGGFEYGAGIGGGYANNIAGGDIKITGGHVEANGAAKAAGIGTGYNDYCTTNGRSITISGGTVIANGGTDAAGIGGGQGCKGKSVRSITINGSANVTANGGERGAGIGSGYGSTSVMATSIDIRDSAVVVAKGGNDDDFGGAGIGTGGASGGIGNININGGTVTATGGTAKDSSMHSGAGIGSGGNSKIVDVEGGPPYYKPATGEITINAGTITATGGTGAAGIGDGDGGKGGDFSTGENGQAVIYASSISDKDDTSDWGGIIFQDKEGTVYGDVTLSDDLSLSAGQTMTVPADSSLTVPEGKTLTVNGTLTNNGQILNFGTIDKTGTITGNDPVDDPEATYTNVSGKTTYYETIGEAISASNAGGGGTITLLKNAELKGDDMNSGDTDTVSGYGYVDYIMSNLTLDLGSFTLETADYTLAIDPNITLTIENGTFKNTNKSGVAIMTTKDDYDGPGSTVIIKSDAQIISNDGIMTVGHADVFVYGEIKCENRAIVGTGPKNDVTLENAKITAGGFAVYQENRDGGSVYNITNSNIVSTDSWAVYIGNNKDSSVASNQGMQTLDINNSKISGENGIMVFYTNVDIDGEDTEVTAEDEFAFAVAHNMGENEGAVGNVSIKNGTFNGELEILEPYGNAENEAVLTVSGGKFDTNVDGEYVAANLKYGAWDGEYFTYHETREDAIEAAAPNGYIFVVTGPGHITYTVTIVYGNGSANDSWLVVDNEEINLPTAPSKPGYIFLGWRNGDTTYGAGDPVVVTSDMTFYAVWANMPDVTPGTPGGGDDEPVAVFPFNDVSVLDWFYDSVYYVWENDLMNGTDVNQFSPNSPLTRAMVWAVLARVDGETISGDSWMTDAQAWAVESGVSDGTDPTGYVTREQLVTMLYRFAGEPAGAADISGYPDAASISDWAADAMAWAVKVGLIEGDDVGALNPTANSTRAHAATFFMRFSKTIL